MNIKVASNYNFNSLSYLIAYFKELVGSFGQTSKTVEFYRKQVDYLVSIGQINSIDAELIQSLIGMENTDVIKWEPSIERVKQFTEIVNIVYGPNDLNFISYVIESNASCDNINLQVYKLLKKVYGLDNYTKPKNKNGVFGEYPTTGLTSSKPKRLKTDTEYNNLEAIRDDYKEIDTLLNLLSKYNKNPNKLKVSLGESIGSSCYIDCYMDYTLFLKLLDTQTANTSEYKLLLDRVRAGFNFYIGYTKVYNTGCDSVNRWVGVARVKLSTDIIEALDNLQ